MNLRQLSPCTTEKMKEQLGYKTRVVDKLDKTGSDGWSEKLKILKVLSRPDVLHSSSDGSHMLLSVSPQSKFIISFLVLMLMASWTLRFQ